MTTETEIPEPVNRNAAPDRLELVRQFINTADVDERDGRACADTGGLQTWLAEKRLLGAGTRAYRGDRHQRAIDFREALREILLGHTGGEVGSATVRRFDAVVSSIPMRLRVDDTGWVRVAAAGRGFDGALAELLARVYEAMEDGSWQRLKTCADDNCRWAFYDHSKNRSGHWCNMAVCGNRAKVNAFRQRQAGSKSPRKGRPGTSRPKGTARRESRPAELRDQLRDHELRLHVARHGRVGLAFGPP